MAILNMFVNDSDIPGGYVQMGNYVRSRITLIIQIILMIVIPIMIYLIHFKRYKIKLDE
jgi:hypothetical protein